MKSYEILVASRTHIFSPSWAEILGRGCAERRVAGPRPSDGGTRVRWRSPPVAANLSRKYVLTAISAPKKGRPE